MKKKKVNYNLIIGLILTSIVVLMAVVGHFWTPYGTTDMNGILKNAAPSLAHPFGNDNFGRDILSRIMNGMGTTCFVALCTCLLYTSSAFDTTGDIDSMSEEEFSNLLAARMSTLDEEERREAAKAIARKIACWRGGKDNPLSLREEILIELQAMIRRHEYYSSR